MKRRSDALRINHSFLLLIVVGLLIGFGLPANSARAATLSVTTLADSGAGSLRAVVAAANPGDTINFAVAGTIRLTSGEIEIEDDLTISGPGADSLTISGNSSSRIFNITSGTVAISDLTFTQGHVVNNAGSAIQAAVGTSLTLRRAIFSNNNRSCCGAVYSVGVLNVFDSTFSNNRAGNGPGIYANGTVTIERSTFVGNATDANDGGAIFAANGTWNITNSTVSGNTTGGLGGGLVTGCGTGASPQVTITNSTIADNSAGSGDGLYRCQGTITIRNTIVADNMGGNCVGVTSGGNNLSSDGSCGGQPDDLLNQNPLLFELADNGGPTQTHALQSNSPALNVGEGGVCPATDQRGVDRPQGTECDIGAFERTQIIDLNNHTWPEAYELDLIPDSVSSEVLEATVDQHLAVFDQSAWFKFTVQPSAQVAVSLSNLPANYDLVLYKDIAAAYQTITTPQQLVRQSAEFAPNYITPNYITPNYITPNYITPNYITPNYITPNYITPNYITPNYITPNYITPNYITPGTSPTPPSPEAYSNAQLRSILTYSAQEGTADELVVQNTWDNAAEYYVRVRGRDGAFSLDAPFRLQVSLFTGACGSIAPIGTPSTINAVPGSFKTLIFTDLGRMEGVAADKAALWTKLGAFAARPEIAGRVINVGQYTALGLAGDARVSAANTQADANPGCPYAKNLVASTIKELVDKFRAVNPALEYIVLVGNDGVIPFFRQPEQVELGEENSYEPPVRPDSSSHASLQLGYVLSQDRYGSQVELSSLNRTFPIPNLAVGRLVETATEASGVLDAYGRTNAGVVATPTTSLVTGYDFLTPAAQAVQANLEAGIGQPADTLLSARDLSLNAPLCTNTVSPQARCLWTAEHLRSRLLGSRHDLIYLAGHFSQAGALAADYATQLNAIELARSEVNLENAIVFSAGCHSGYNTVNGDALANITATPDWAQVAGQKRFALIAGTGYQYGDTDTLEYGARLYAEFSRQLRVGTGPVAIGKALVAAKNSYLETTPTLGGIHDKTLLQATLYGLPMLKVNLPAGRIPLQSDNSIVSATTPIGTSGLSRADVNVDPNLQRIDRTLTSTSNNNTTVTATYFSGTNGIASEPDQPILPLELRNVSVPNLVVRGTGLRSAVYSDLQNIVPLTSAPSTELSDAHGSFFASSFFPNQPWSVNYFGALATAGGPTRLAFTPAQFRSNAPGVQSGVLRQYTDATFRLYYSNNLDIATAGAPAITSVAAAGINTLDFEVIAQGDTQSVPPAPIVELWVTYTAVNGSLNGEWTSLDLARNSSDQSRWSGTLALPAGTNAQDVRFIVQAASAGGLVTLDTNLGAYYTPVSTPPPAAKGATTLTLQTPATSGNYTESKQFSATLRNASGAALSGKTIVFNLGSQIVPATTNGNGIATAALQLTDVPGHYTIKATFDETADLLASDASSPIEIKKLGTTLTLAAPSAGQFSDATPVVATLKDVANPARPLVDKTVYFRVTGPGGPYERVVRTDYLGRAALKLALASGNYTFDATFGQDVQLINGATLELVDDQYGPSTKRGTLAFTDRNPPVISFLPNRVLAATNVAGALRIAASWQPTATDANPAQPNVTCNPASGSTFASGMTTVTCTARDAAGNTATRSFTVKVYPLLGYASPVQTSTGSGIVYNQVTNGSTVSAKFKLFLGTTQITDPAQTSITLAQVSCTLTAAETAIVASPLNPANVRYDAGSKQFVFDWTTPRTPGACYRLTATAKEYVMAPSYPGSINKDTALVAYFKLN